VQNSPLQSGHLQTSQPQQAAFFATFAAATAVEAFDLAAIWQPQLPHSQTSHVQNSPLQSGHLQPTQRQPELTLAEVLGPANARAYVNTTATAVSRAKTEKLFMEKDSYWNGLKMRDESISDPSFAHFNQVQ